MLRYLKDKQDLYYLAHGQYAGRWEDLSVYDFSGNIGVKKIIGNFNYSVPSGLVQTGMFEASLKENSYYWLMAYPGQNGGIYCVPRYANAKGVSLCERFSKTYIRCPEFVSNYSCYRIQ